MTESRHEERTRKQVESDSDSSDDENLVEEAMQILADDGMLDDEALESDASSDEDAPILKKKAPKKKAPKEPKAQKPTKAPKAPKAPKEPKAPKKPKEPKEPKAPKKSASKTVPEEANGVQKKKKSAPKSKKENDNDVEMNDGAIVVVEKTDKPKKKSKRAREEDVEPSGDGKALVSYAMDGEQLALLDMEKWEGRRDVPFAKAQKFCKSVQELMMQYTSPESFGSFVNEVQNMLQATHIGKVPPVESMKFSKQFVDLLRLHTQVEFERQLEVWRNVCTLQGKQTLSVNTINTMLYFLHSGNADLGFLAQKTPEQLVLDAFENCETAYPIPRPTKLKEVTPEQVAAAQARSANAVAFYLQGIHMDTPEEAAMWLSESTTRRCAEALCSATIHQAIRDHNTACDKGDEVYEAKGLPDADQQRIRDTLAQWKVASVDDAVSQFVSEGLQNQACGLF